MMSIYTDAPIGWDFGEIFLQKYAATILLVRCCGPYYLKGQCDYESLASRFHHAESF